MTAKFNASRSGSAPSHEAAQAKFRNAMALHHQGQFAQAQVLYEETLRLQPGHFDAQHLLGVLALQSDDFKRAAELIGKAIAIRPNFAGAYNNYGNALNGLKQFAAALDSYDRAIALKPDYAEAYCSRGMVLQALRRNEEALQSYDRAIALKPDFADAYNNRGNVLREMARFEAALHSYDRAIALRPDFADAYNNRGNVLRDMGQLELARQSYDRAIALRPAFVEAYNNRGVALSDQMQPQAALHSHDQAIALRPDYADAHYNRGNALVSLMQHEAALQSYEQAIVLKPDHAGAYAALAKARIDLGQFESAQLALSKALELQPEHPAALAALPGLRKMTPEDAGWLSKALKLASQGNSALAAKDLIIMQFAIGKYYDDTKQYDLAFAAYRKANELKRQKEGVFDRAGFSGQVDALIAAYTTEVIQRQREAASQSRRPVFVVGMPRSGTSLIEQIIASHPDAAGAGELSFWQTQARVHAAAAMSGSTDPALIAETAAAYEQQLQQHSAGASRIVDKMPHNFIWLGWISTIFPQAKIIHAQRNPVDTCLSIYFQNFLAYHSYGTDLDDLAFYYREYLRLMAHWRSVLPADRFLEVPYEALVDDQAAWSPQLIEFIGLEWDERCLDFHKTERKVATASNWQVKQKIYHTSKARWRNYESHLGPLLGLLDNPAAP